MLQQTRLVGIVGQVWQAKLKQLQRLGSRNRLEAGQMPQPGKSAVGTHRERRVNLVPAVIGTVTYALDKTIMFDQLLHVGPHT